MKIMELYALGLGYAKIHNQLNRSTKSLHDYVNKHSNSVKRGGFCVICRRAGGGYSEKVVKRRILTEGDFLRHNNEKYQGKKMKKSNWEDSSSPFPLQAIFRSVTIQFWMVY
jgi:hypothetical protein